MVRLGRDLSWLGPLVRGNKGLAVDVVGDAILHLDGLAVDQVRLVLPFADRALKGVFQFLRINVRTGQDFDRSVFADEDGNVEDAIRDYQTAIQEDPNSPLTWKLLGEIQMVNGTYSQAIQSFEKAGQLDPGNPQPALYEGLAYAKLPNGTDAALGCFFRSLRKNPELPDPYFWIGSLYLHRAHKYILAEKYLEEAVKRAPRWAAANQALIQCYRILKEDQKAEALDLRYKEGVSQSQPGPDGEVLLEPQQ